MTRWFCDTISVGVVALQHKQWAGIWILLCAWRHTGMIHWDFHWSRANTNHSLVKPVFFPWWRIITSTMILPLHWAVMTTGLHNDQLGRTHLVTTTYSSRLVSPGRKSLLLATMSQRLQPRDKLKTIHSMLFTVFPCLPCFPLVWNCHRKQNKITRIWLVIAR